jgi:hypothetical protein
MTNVLFAKAQPSLSLPPGSRRCGVVVGLAVLADWLFYGQAVSLSAALFLLALYLGMALANPLRVRRPEALLALGILTIAVVPLLMRPTLLAFLFGVLGTAYAAQTLVGAGSTLSGRVYGSICLLVDGSWRAAYDLFRAGTWWSRSGRATARAGALIVWIVPLGFGAVFLLLFAAANPLIDSWLGAIDLSALAAHVSVGRIAFWLLVIALVWPFVYIRRRRKLPARLAALGAAPVAPAPDGTSTRLFGKAAILRSLILFNLLFAVQTVLDVAYLWGGVALPDGLTYAAYAHRGAYPLIATALLAAAFVIAATRPGSDAARSPLIRHLVFLWTAQNVALVVSSILRLDLYVAVYSLTYLRVAAFVWMLLVGAGLVLIVARIVLDRSNAWLVAANLVSLALTLYLLSFINFPRLIAEYNVQHSREIAGSGAGLDTCYLLDLGPQAIPAIDAYVAHLGPVRARELVDARDRLAVAHRVRMTDWRAWSYDDWQLMRYLDRGVPGGSL